MALSFPLVNLWPVSSAQDVAKAFHQRHTGVVASQHLALGIKKQSSALEFGHSRTCRRTQCRRLRSTKASSSESAPQKSGHSSSALEEFLALATSLYPVYMLVGGLLALTRPSVFSWFVRRSPGSYSLALGTIMLSMGFTLRLQDLVEVLLKRPLAVVFGFIAQYAIMPLLGAGVSRWLRLSPMLSAGLILMSCCPGGTASNVVTYIARGDVPLSVIMTMCTTFGAVFATPLLTLFYAGTYIPVDVKGLATSTLQVVLGPVLLGAWLQGTFPKGVACVKPFAPLAAVLISSLLASSVFSANVALLDLSTASAAANGPLMQVVVGVLIIHAAGFFLGYLASKLAGFNESQSRAISIEVGMQNSSLGVVLASAHFGSPLACIPPAVSAVLMNIMGSGLAVIWRHFGETESQSTEYNSSP